MALTSLRDEITFVALALERRHVAKAVAIALNGSRSILHQTRTRLVTSLSVVPHVAGTGIILAAAMAIAFDEGFIRMNVLGHVTSHASPEKSVSEHWQIALGVASSLSTHCPFPLHTLTSPPAFVTYPGHFKSHCSPT